MKSSGTNVSEAMMQEDGNNPDEAVLNAGNKASSQTGYVYIESNDAGWQILSLCINRKQMAHLNGFLTTASGGKGSGAGLRFRRRNCN